MKKSSYLLLISIILTAACGGKSNDTQTTDEKGKEQKTVADTTIYGKCVDAAMHSLVMLSEKGDTLFFSLEDFSQERRADIQGGLLIDDKLAVIAEFHGDLHFPAKIINLTTLQGEWKGAGRDFDFEEGGTIDSHVEYETQPYTTWKIFNGRLVLAPDTFDIIQLTDDSLSLENDKGIYEYKRIIPRPGRK